jgi:hypothetical protein
MAGIHRLPPEVLVKIFVLAGTADTIKACPSARLCNKDPANPSTRNSRDLYALATSSRFLYATFKTNEYQIFFDLLKELAFKFEHYPVNIINKSAASLVYRMILDDQFWPFTTIPNEIDSKLDFGPGGTEARIERMCQQDFRQVIKPEHFGKVLHGARWGMLDVFRRRNGQCDDTQFLKRRAEKHHNVLTDTDSSSGSRSETTNGTISNNLADANVWAVTSPQRVPAVAMAGIHSLPPELLVEIFVSAGAADTIKACLGADIFGEDASNPPPRKSRDLYALAISTRSLYATFKANEYQIFLNLVKEIASKFEPCPASHSNERAASLLYRTMVDCNGDFDEQILADIEMERMGQQEVRQVIKPKHFGEILRGVRNGLHFVFFCRNLGTAVLAGIGDEALASLIDSLPDA